MLNAWNQPTAQTGTRIIAAARNNRPEELNGLLARIPVGHVVINTRDEVSDTLVTHTHAYMNQITK